MARMQFRQNPRPYYRTHRDRTSFAVRPLSPVVGLAWAYIAGVVVVGGGVVVLAVSGLLAAVLWGMLTLPGLPT